MPTQKQQALDRYSANAHGMQSGVAMELASELPNLSEELRQFLKHERVGVNSALSNCEAIADLLMKKGIVTELEYLEALADAMEKERKRYEERLGALLSSKVTLR